MRKRNLSLVVSTILLFVVYGCLKKDDSFTSSLAGSLGASTYYYKLCGQTVCKFSCDVRDTSSLTEGTVPSKCKNLEAMKNVLELQQTFDKSDRRQEFYTKIIIPIRESNKLNIVSVDDDLFEDFDDIFSGPENFCDPKQKDSCSACKSSCDGSNAALILNPWLVTKEGYDFIYQKSKKGSDISKLLWSGIIRKSGQEGKMSYKEAVDTCKNYRFKYSDWSLPTRDQWQTATKEKLDNELLMDPINEDIDNDIDSDLKNNIWIKESKESGFRYTICVRNLTT